MVAFIVDVYESSCLCGTTNNARVRAAHVGVYARLLFLKDRQCDGLSFVQTTRTHSVEVYRLVLFLETPLPMNIDIPK